MIRTRLQLRKNQQAIILIFFLNLIVGSVCELVYRNYDTFHSKAEAFELILNEKQKKANELLAVVENNNLYKNPDALASLDIRKKHAFSFYLYEGDELVYWTDNQLDVDGLAPLAKTNEWKYHKLPNAHVIVKSLLKEERYVLLAVIKVKSDYSFENEKLVNSFEDDFDLDKGVQIKYTAAQTGHSVRNLQGDYLFSLYPSKSPVYSQVLLVVGFISNLLTILFLILAYSFSYWLFPERKMPLGAFAVLTLFFAFILGASLYFNFPSLLYWNKYFSPFQYASTPVFSSLFHLTIVTAFFLVSNILFFLHVNFSSKGRLFVGFFLQMLFGIYFLLVYHVLRGLVFDSSVQLLIVDYGHFNWTSVWMHFLVFLWGLSLTLLFYKTHNWLWSQKLIRLTIWMDLLVFCIVVSISYFLYSINDLVRFSLSFFLLLMVFYIPFFFRKKKIYYYAVGWVFIYTLVFVSNIYLFTKERAKSKYQIMAENILINGNVETDKIAEVLLEELDTQLLKDVRVQYMMNYPDSSNVLNQYINETYLRGYWNKYDMRVVVSDQDMSIDQEYNNLNLFDVNANRIKNTHFYTYTNSGNDLSFVGVFDHVNKKNVFYLEFYARKKFRSYSFPTLLISSTTDIQKELGISVARYEEGQLLNPSIAEDFPLTTKWLPHSRAKYQKVRYNSTEYYVYRSDESKVVVVKELRPITLQKLLLYYLYILFIFYALIALGLKLYLMRHKKNGILSIGLITRFQYAFLLLLIISFIAVFYVSVNYIQDKYQEKQLLNLENKISFIQKELQEKYYWIQDLSTINTQQLNFDLQELSYKYQTDIHIYDNHGFLKGSSQPLIFNKGLISKYLSPEPLFGPKSKINKMELIGRLEYLAGYDDLLNGDYYHLGYISVPVFLSQDEISAEIQSFFSVIIHLYLLIIFFSILVSLFVGRQLSAPLKMIEGKLKLMRIGQRNEKIDYHYNDEIGQLVIQYNRTIDELERSAKLLAQSERESAWKTMARQIAHEINNPLTPMKLTIQQLQRTKVLGDERFDDYFERSTQTLIEQIDNLSRIAGTFSNFARMPEAHFVTVDIAAKLCSVVELFKENNDQINILFQGPTKGLMVFADPEQLIQVFNNLIKNAIQSIPMGCEGSVTVEIEDYTNQVKIRVVDNGCGISQEDSVKLFVPNFTTKTTGMGLGLSISKNIIEMAGGSIRFNSIKGSGTTFEVILPKER